MTLNDVACHDAKLELRSALGALGRADRLGIAPAHLLNESTGPGGPLRLLAAGGPRPCGRFPTADALALR